MNSFKNPDVVDGDALTSIADHVFDSLGLKDPLTKCFIDAALRAVQVFDHKQQRYGPGNIAAFGEHGVLVRAHDKLARLINLHRTGQEPTDETRDD